MLSFLFRNTPKRNALNEALIELIYAGNALANHLIVAPRGVRFCALCGDSLEGDSAHDAMCPVQRHINAVEDVRKLVK
jgi:hypothetical protein